MDIAINYWAVIVCGVLAMVLGFIWYGPLFGKKWMDVIGASSLSREQSKEMQKRMMRLYVVQFALVLFQAYILAYYIKGWDEVSGLANALWIWVAFVIPTVAGSSMWNNEPGKKAWSRFLIQAGYQLILFMSFGLVLGFWK